MTLDLPAGHDAMIAVLSGHVTFEGEATRQARPRSSRFERGGSGRCAPGRMAKNPARGLPATPIDEPVVGHGPFVMNSQTEIRQAIDDFNTGRFGAIAA